MSDDLTFVDTNVLVYAYDADAGNRHDAAQAILVELWNGRTGAASTQVLQEFYVTVTRKLSTPVARQTAREIMSTYRAWPIHRPEIADVIAASELEEHHSLSFWDALVVTSAQRVGAHTLLSEDLQDGRRIGELVIVNPFADETG